MAPVEPAGAELSSDEAEAVDHLNVEVAMSPAPREVRLVALSLPPGATVAQALGACGLLANAADAADSTLLHVGIWGRKATLDAALRDGDRVECYRALKVDPKEARRVRYRAHGEKLPKGVHRPRGRGVDTAVAPGQAPDEPAD